MSWEQAGVDEILQALDGKDAVLRWAAAEFVPALPERKSLPINALCQTLSDPVEAVRFAAVDALASLGRSAKEAGPALVAALRDESAAVRNAAADALAATGNGIPSILPILMRQLSSPRKMTRFRGAIALGNLGPLGICARTALIQAARDPDRDVSAAAASALKRIRSSFHPPTAFQTPPL